MRLISRLLSLLGLGKSEDTRPSQDAPAQQNAPEQCEDTLAPDTPRQVPEQENPEQTDEDTPQESGEKDEALERFEAMSTQEQRIYMIKLLCKHFISLAEELPETGLFKPISLCIQYPGTDNLAHLKIEMNTADRASTRLLTAFCAREGTDMAVNHYLEKGPTSKLIAWLRREETIAELKCSFDELSDSVDDKW